MTRKPANIPGLSCGLANNSAALKGDCDITWSSALSQGEQSSKRDLTLFLFILITSIMPHKMGIMQLRRSFFSASATDAPRPQSLYAKGLRCE
jgi:hypothetical protein